MSPQIFGVLFLVIGLFLKFGLDRVLAMLGLNMETLVSSLKSANEALGGSLSSLSQADMVSELASTLEVAIAVFIALGVFMLVVAILGCCGACCSAKVLLALVCMIRCYVNIFPLRFSVSIATTQLNNARRERLRTEPKDWEGHPDPDAASASDVQLTIWLYSAQQ